MNRIANKNISLLKSRLSQSIPPEGRIITQVENKKILDVVNTIEETGLSFIINERINPAGVEEFDNIVNELKNDFYKLTSYLKKNGFIDIRGYDVYRKTNI